MPNTSAILGVAQVAAKTGAQAAAGAGITGAASVLGAAVPIIGLAAVAAPYVIDLFKCGTLGTIGCVKRADANTQIAAMLNARQIAYQVETGQITPSQGSTSIQQILQSAPQQFQRPTDWTGAPPTPVDIACGSQGGVPAGSRSASIDCKTIDSPQQVVSDLLAYVQTVAPPAGSPAASQLAAANPLSAVSSAASAATAATGLPGWVLLAGLAAGLYFLVK